MLERDVSDRDIRVSYLWRHCRWLDIMPHSSNPNTQEAEEGILPGSWDHPRLHSKFKESLVFVTSCPKTVIKICHNEAHYFVQLVNSSKNWDGKSNWRHITDQHLSLRDKSWIKPDYNILAMLRTHHPSLQNSSFFCTGRALLLREGGMLVFHDSWCWFLIFVSAFFN